MYNGREVIINVFKNEVFPFYLEKSEFEDEDKNNIRAKNGLIDYKKLDRLISLKKDINDDLIRKHFQAQTLEFNSQNQERKGLQILTKTQMIRRLLISLAQSKAENNSEKLKNEIS